MTDLAELFLPGAVAPETAAFEEWLAETLAALPPVNEVPPELTRKARAEGLGVFPLGGPLAGSEWCDIPGAPGGPGRVRISLPPGTPTRTPPGTPRGTYLHIHGGGWTLGCPDQQDVYNQRIAAATGCRVVSAQYRLAPENPWPAGAEDCAAAAAWALEAFDGPVLIGGESAGAHLAAVTLLGLKAQGRAGRLAGAVLNYGCYDLRMTPSVTNWGDYYLVLSTPVIDWFIGNLLPEGGRDDPAVSPLLADLAGLPPALFQIGSRDPLLDDSLFMAARWQAAGNRAELAVYPGGVHAYDMFDLAIAHQSHARQDAFVSACLEGWSAATPG
jgi:acetyl esterase/lipase